MRKKVRHVRYVMIALCIIAVTADKASKNPANQQHCYPILDLRFQLYKHCHVWMNDRWDRHSCMLWSTFVVLKKIPWKWSYSFHNCLGWWLKVWWGSSHNYHSFFWSTIHDFSYFTLHSLLGFSIFLFNIYISYLTEVLVIVKKGRRRTLANRK